MTGELRCTRCRLPAVRFLEHGRDARGVLRVVAVRARCPRCGAGQRVEIEHGRRVNPRTGELVP